MSVKFTDNSDAVLAAFEEACLRGLEECGLVAEGYAKKLAPVDTGNLRDSITHTVDPVEKAAYVGTNSEYGVYVEMGTGQYATNGGGRPGWWVYVKGSKGSGGSGSMKIYTREEAKRIVAMMRSEGLDAHMTQGRRAKPFIKPAVVDHQQKYISILRRELKDG